MCGKFSCACIADFFLTWVFFDSTDKSSVVCGTCLSLSQNIVVSKFIFGSCDENYFYRIAVYNICNTECAAG